MPSLTWPIAPFPQKIFVSPGEEPQNVFLVTQTDKGTYKSRKKQTGRWIRYACQIKVTEAQKHEFYTFFYDQAKGAANLFSFVRPSDLSVPADCRFAPDVTPTVLNQFKDYSVIGFSLEVRQ